MAGKSVDANYRFIAAYQEVNARITQRQQALALYVTLTVSLLAALVALRPANENVPVEWLVLGFPVASLSFAFLNYKAERAITNLRRFLAALERLTDSESVLPGYNTDPQWAQNANEARRFHDFAAAILVAGGNVVGLGAALAIYPQRISLASPALSVSIVIAMLSILALLLSPRWRYIPAS